MEMTQTARKVSRLPDHMLSINSPNVPFPPEICSGVIFLFAQV